MKKIYFVSFVASLICMLFTFWPAKYSIFEEGWTQSVCFFSLTFILLEKYAKTDSGAYYIALFVVLGRIVLEIPIRIMDYFDSLFSILVPIIAIASIVLATICYKEKRTSVYILAAIIVVLLNTVTHHTWYNFIRQ